MAKALDPWFVTGFVEGMGSFTFSRAGRTLNLFFAVKVGESDRPLLEAIAAFFGVGAIYAVKARGSQRPGSGYTKAGAYFRVTRIADLDVVVRHFHAYPLRGAQQRAFGVWEEMVELKARNFRRPPLEELGRLAELLSAASRGQAV